MNTNELDLVRLREIVGDIEALRQNEGNSVTICCDNPEAEILQKQAAVDCCSDFTGWEVERFWGQDWAEALHRAADQARRHNATLDSTAM